ncbi:permease [Halodurantibacterium flavum]|uniref:Permease n=1 Tax=Halodurantibacterium flavum TaxID=1382802 RepID=A0ABW4S2Z0_9RHOB
MADAGSHSHDGHHDPSPDHSHDHGHGARRGVDKVVIAILAIPVLLALFDPMQVRPALVGAAGALAGTLPYILFAVIAVAWLKAAEAEGLVARAFQGHELRMILLAAMVGGLAPFCSCEIIPLIAALLALGAPLSAVMALWLASPLMDPAMFAVTAGGLGLDFALAKTAAAIGIGIGGGLIVRAFAASPVFADPLRKGPAPKASCCGGGTPRGLTVRPEWRFWTDAGRRTVFGRTAAEQFLFLLKWLALAYLLQSLMLAYVPAEMIVATLGGEGLRPVLLAALVGAPAYLNGYAAVPLVAGMVEQGMSPGAAMAFVVAGGISCIPAAVAVWALVKPRVFAAYLGIALGGAVIAGSLWQMA